MSCWLPQNVDLAIPLSKAHTQQISITVMTCLRNLLQEICIDVAWYLGYVGILSKHSMVYHLDGDSTLCSAVGTYTSHA